MKKSIVLGLAVLTLSSMNLMARGGGDAFAGGLAGGMVGGVVSGAMQPREKTVVVQQPSYSSDEENAQLRRENRQLRRNLDELERRLEKLEGRK